MSDFYYLFNKKTNKIEEGSFVKHELIERLRQIQGEGLVCKNGDSDWVEISEYPEFGPFLPKPPPPPPKTSPAPNSNPTYDPNYDGNESAIFIGAVLLLSQLILYLLIKNDAIRIERFSENINYIRFLGVIARIAIVVWVGKIAIEANREAIPWRIFAFFLPSISLIFVGFTKKKISRIPVPEPKNPKVEKEVWLKQNPGKTVWDCYKENPHIWLHDNPTKTLIDYYKIFPADSTSLR